MNIYQNECSFLKVKKERHGYYQITIADKNYFGKQVSKYKTDYPVYTTRKEAENRIKTAFNGQLIK